MAGADRRVPLHIAGQGLCLRWLARLALCSAAAARRDPGRARNDRSPAAREPGGWRRSLRPCAVIILGLNAFHGDSAAALVRDGVLLAAAEEERFRRVKHWAGFPAQSIAYCLREAGLRLSDVA